MKLDLSAFLDLDHGPSKHGVLHEVCYYDHSKSAFRSVAHLAIVLHIPTYTSEPGKSTTSLLTTVTLLDYQASFDLSLDQSS